jgi:hypothetical protein
MKKKTENLLFQFTHTEYCDAMKEWYNEIINDNDIKNRALDPNKDQHQISKLAGSTETLLAIVRYFDEINERIS